MANEIDFPNEDEFDELYNDINTLRTMLNQQLTPDWNKLLREQGLAGRLDYCVIEANIEIEVAKAKAAHFTEAFNKACLSETNFVSLYSEECKADMIPSAIARGVQEAENTVLMEESSASL